MPQSLATHQTMVLVDVASFTHPDRTMAHQRAVRGGLYGVLKEAFAETGVDWAACYHEDRGDGAMILVPPDVPALVLANQLLDRLISALREHNAIHVHEASIRLRLVLHAGPVQRDEAGVAGLELNSAFRLLDAPEAKKLLRESTAVLAVIASDTFYRDIVSQEPSAAPDLYRPIHVDLKTFSGDAWLRLLGQKDEIPEVLGQFTDQELDRVRAWLADVKEPNFDIIARRAARSALPLPRFDDPFHAFTRLEDVNAGPDGVPASLVYLDALATEVGGDLGAAMTAWVEEKVRQLHIEEAFQERRRTMSHSVDEPRLHLLISLDHDGIASDRYLLSAWRQDAPDVWPPPRTEIRDVELEHMERAFDEVVVSAERAWADQHASVTLEVLLPRELLHLPVQRWSKEHESGQPQPLCLDYDVRVRSLERMKFTHWHRVWRERWISMQADPSPARIHFANGDVDRVDVVLRDQNAVAMVLTAAPLAEQGGGARFDEFTAALRSGLPVLLWHPAGTSKELHELVTWLVGRGGLIGLPERTKESRRAMLGSSILPFGNGLIGDLVVLWDDPDRTVVLGFSSNASS
jgi:hypothetical protein